MWCDFSYNGHAWINDLEVYNSGDANGGHNPQLSIRSDGVYHWKSPSFWEQLIGTEGQWLLLRKADKDFFDWIT
ncbi:hypothetical protein FRX31_010973 [Thalictrum thalictroides]|uniref:Uncharacterized protein n=1 Tax=Thalictrum thalictroides TaxID=46969 RepID=A0A7J6WS67_THATH|nr:hypothetical protein FRX31_010973 [Thalictrum thalictroides]